MSFQRIGKVNVIIGDTGSGKTHRVTEDALLSIQSGNHVFILSGNIEGAINGVLDVLNMPEIGNGTNTSPYFEHFYWEKRTFEQFFPETHLQMNHPKIHVFSEWMGCWTVDMATTLFSRLFPLVPANSVVVFDGFQYVSEAVGFLHLLNHNISFVIADELDEHVIPLVEFFNKHTTRT